MSTEQKGFIVYKDLHAVVDELTDEQAGQLFKGMIAYSANGTEPKFDGILKFVFIPIKQQMDRDSDKYGEKCEKMRANANKRWQGNANASNSNQMDANNANTKTKTNTDTDTNTNTKTNTDTKTTTTTNTDTNVAERRRGGSGYDDDFNIFKLLGADGIDRIYEVYPDSGGDLIQEVYEDVKTKRKKVANPVSYVLGYAKNVGWDDKADHIGGA